MDLKITPPGQTIVKPTALGPGANTDTKLLIYGLFQKGRVLAQDAVGTTLEFCSRDTQPRLEDMVGGGPFDLPAGAWTDDTAMALALADSLAWT